MCPGSTCICRRTPRDVVRTRRVDAVDRQFGLFDRLMRGNDEPRQTSFYVCFAVALWATMGIAFAKNLFTLFVFYEILTFSTYRWWL